MGHYPPPTLHPCRGSLPVLLSVPHSGRDYPAAALANAAKGRSALEALEDPLVDRLVWRAVGGGVGAVVQNVPRAIIDCNRDEEEVDPVAIRGIGPSAVGPRARHGLGIVPSRTDRHGLLWRRPIDRDEFRRRLEQVHAPYHRALSEGLDQLRATHDEALLLDCHSMPPRRGAADVVIGDRHGTSAATWLSAEAARLARAEGFRVALNDPYAGGAIIARHGRPDRGIHALQIEICRSAYLKPDGRTPGLNFDRVATLIERLAVGLGTALLDCGLRDAAE
ncbi:MAG TPA: N-formylglutamate amidohydrolase [Sphingomicrobium sp.]|nr:N-formylglutamate amidohydrolase [Sphingomicrobium sp.]